MKVATIVFVYNRSNHTKKVLNGLKYNYKLPEKLFIFQDGLKDKDNKEEWIKVNRLIHEIDWCNNEVIVSDYNKGLSDSIQGNIQ